MWLATAGSARSAVSGVRARVRQVWRGDDAGTGIPAAFLSSADDVWRERAQPQRMRNDPVDEWTGDVLRALRFRRNHVLVLDRVQMCAASRSSSGGNRSGGRGGTEVARRRRGTACAFDPAVGQTLRVPAREDRWDRDVGHFVQPKGTL